MGSSGPCGCFYSRAQSADLVTVEPCVFSLSNRPDTPSSCFGLRCLSGKRRKTDCSAAIRRGIDQLIANADIVELGKLLPRIFHPSQCLNLINKNGSERSKLELQTNTAPRRKSYPSFVSLLRLSRESRGERPKWREYPGRREWLFRFPGKIGV
jgi:hypothetical protein